MNKIPLRKRGFRKCLQGIYKCKNPEKYIGDSNNIIYRSGLELNAFKYCDMNSNIKKWASELVIIPYFDKSTNKNRNYYTDIYLEYIDKNSEYKKNIIEIKMSNQTVPPSKRGRFYEKRLSEYIKNMSKWEAAKVYAEHNNMNFYIMTEKDLT